MARPRLRRLLQDWFRDQVEAAPAEDRRRTPLCLRFWEVPAQAAQTLKLPTERAAHVSSCAWCQRSVEQWIAAAAPEGISISLGAQAEWPPELRERLANWLRTMAEEEPPGAFAPAHFDEDGTLLIHWAGLALEGPVTVSLSWQGTDVPLTRGVARQGVLDIRDPMPGLGVRNLSIAERLLRVKREEAT